MRIYYNGFLPHWRQDGCTYFVTFRLADSIPSAVLNQWRYERGKWLQTRGIDADSDDWIRQFSGLPREEKRRFESHFVSLFFSKLDECLGQCVFRAPEHAREVSQSLRYFNGERLDVGDSVVMPNHVHALITPYPGYELEQILHSIKSYSANRIQRQRRTSGQLWMRESHDHIVRDGEELVRIQEYIRANPAKVSLSDNEFVLHAAEYALS